MSTTERASILLVDDQPKNLVALKAVLEPLGHELVSASSGAEALRQLLRREFALILLDVQMPELDGFRTAAYIKQRERSRGIPIIFLTAISKDAEAVLRGYEAGAADYVVKPVDPVLLRSKVEVFLELDRKTRALQRSVDDLARSNAELEQFAYIVSHDIKEPLAVVSGYTELLTSRFGDTLGADGNVFIDGISSAVTRVRELIDDLLAYSRVGRGEPETEPVDFGALVAEVIETLRPAIEEAGAEVTADRLPTLSGCLVELRQLFQNLLTNALKFSGERPPQIHVGAERTAGAWRFSVSDNGIGIEESERERVFEMFKRVGGATTPGTGIGLAICRKVVERHGGRIWVDSTPGAGSAFRFTIHAAEGIIER
jgi:two-component system, sensor histidine kinase and response regulator